LLVSANLACVHGATPSTWRGKAFKPRLCTRTLLVSGATHRLAALASVAPRGLTVL
jgi:hypothetical protein